MKKEDIEKAAKDYSIDKTYFRRNVLKEVDADNYVLRKGNCSEDFIAGAAWRINSVWHDASENPKLNKFFVFENKCNEWETDCLYQHQKWNLYVAVNDLIRWAYIEDLLPNTEE